jgi:hypothetical protein
MSRRGSILLVSICILAALSVFALAFASIVRLESRAALNACDTVRARMVADAGLERALFLLTRCELADPVTTFHAPWTYRSQDGASWGHGLPLDQAKNPSFRAGVTPEGLAYSGIVSGTYRAGGDHFALKVVDANARLSLNGQQPALGSMLDALGRAIRDFDRRRLTATDPLHDPGWAAWVATRKAELIAQGTAAAEAERLTAPADPIAGRGAQVVALRASLGGRFESVDQLRAVLAPEDVERLRDHVTVDAWLDAAMVGWDPATGAEVPQWRAPVDVNTASWPVLVACLEGVAPRAAVHPDETAAPIDGATARRLATRIDQRRRGVRSGARFVAPGGEPFRGWADWRAFLDADPALDLTQEAALLANADPNLIYAQRNPDATLHPGLGKRDLAASTTELCFISYGIYEVSSLGRVLSPDGVVAAQVTVHAVAAVYDTLRLLSQADFESARASSELEKSASFPNPVRAVTGSCRVQTASDGQEEVVFEPLLDPDERRRLRVQASSRSSGWAQLIADEPSVPRAPEAIAGGYANEFRCDAQCHGQSFPLGGGTNDHVVHLFRFGADLRGELWKFEGRGGVEPYLVEGRYRDLATGITHTGSYVYSLYRRTRVTNGAGDPVWDEPQPEGPDPRVVDRVHAFAVATGTRPAALGLDLSVPADQARWTRLQALAAQLYPPGGRLAYAEDLSPDGLIVRSGRTADVRYENTYGAAALTILDDRSALNLWFKVNLSLLETWSPLLEAYYPVGGLADPNVGRPERYKFQVEARLIHAPAADGYRLQVRSRRMSFDGQGRLRRFRIWDPDVPGPRNGEPDPDSLPASQEAEDFNAPYYERVVEYEVDEARAGEWHYLYVPYYANVHFPWVDGVAGRILRTVVTDDPQVAFGAWPLADWPADCYDRIAPGGFALADDLRPSFPEVTIDELLTTGYQLALRPPEKGGTYDRNAANDLGWGGRANGGFVNVSTRRYTPWGPDHAGTFLADIPAFDVDAVKVGRIIWTQLDPTRWGLKQYDGGDFQSQGAYRYSTEEQRNHLSGRAVPRPRLAMMGDEYVRYWRLVYIDERARFLDALRARYEELLQDAAPEAAPTFAAYRDTFVAEQDALAQEEQAIIDRWGEPRAPADGGASIAFGANTELTQTERQVRLRIDFLYFDRAQQTAQPPVGRDGQEWWQATALNVSPVLDDVIVPYQERVRLLRRWEE